MELVYLWVEKYKNIEKQGFNFSPRFQCHYDEEKNELTIDENKEYVSIFPDNINITAIVGENGSGKSSILHSLPINTDYISYENNILVCYENKQIIIYTKKGIQTTSFQINNDLSFKFQYLSYHGDYFKDYIVDDFFHYTYSPADLNNSLFQEIYIDSNTKIDLVKYYLMVNFLLYSYADIDNLFTYQPKKICLSLRFGEIRSVLQDLKKELEKVILSNPETSDNITNGYDILENLLTMNDYKSMFIVYIFLLVYKKEPSSIDIIKDLYTKGDCDTNNLKTLLCKYIQEKNIDKVKYLCENYDVFVQFFSNKEYFDVTIGLQELRNKEEDVLNLIFKKQVLQILFKIEFYDEQEIPFKDLSQGEKQILILTLAIYEKIVDSNTNNIVILLDEPDLSLHPFWQKQYIDNIIKVFSKRDVRLHLILTSHSPFLLSDLPKENIIFLQDGKQVYPKLETFGANIHTLLSHGFFMKDGLMGEFAKGKIENIRKFYNKVIKYKENEKVKDGYKCFYEKKQEEFWHIQKIIGEPFLQTIVKNQLEEIETILFQDKAQDIQIERYIEEFGVDKIREVLDGKA